MLKSIENGGPDSLEAISTFTDSDKKQQEQRAWNEQNLKALLKKRLDEFVALAVTVDFAAQTTGEVRSRKFVRPDYERKTAEWKSLYRLGKAPTMAAVDFARTWSKELQKFD